MWSNHLDRTLLCTELKWYKNLFYFQNLVAEHSFSKEHQLLGSLHYVEHSGFEPSVSKNRYGDASGDLCMPWTDYLTLDTQVHVLSYAISKNYRLCPCAYATNPNPNPDVSAVSVDCAGVSI